MQQSIVVWVCSKTQILLETLRTRSQHRLNFVHSWRSHICSNQFDVQEANVSISQYHGIGNHFIGCCTANGWITCSGFMGCGDRSDYVHRTTQRHQLNPYLETGANQENARAIHPKPNRRDTEICNSFHNWTMFLRAHIHLKVNLSYFLRTVKQWLK